MTDTFSTFARCTSTLRRLRLRVVVVVVAVAVVAAAPWASSSSPA